MTTRASALRPLLSILSSPSESNSNLISDLFNSASTKISKGHLDDKSYFTFTSHQHRKFECQADSAAMTTFAAPALDGERHDLAAQPSSSPGDAMAIGSNVNGLSTERNALPDYEPPSTDIATDTNDTIMKAPVPDPPPEEVAVHPVPVIPTDFIAQPVDSANVVDHVSTSEVSVNPPHVQTTAIEDIATSTTAPEDEAPAVPSTEEQLNPASVATTSDAPPTFNAQEPQPIAAPVAPSTEILPVNAATISTSDADPMTVAVQANEDAAPPPPQPEVESSQIESQNASAKEEPEAHVIPDQEMVDSVASTKVTREREDDEEELEPSAKRTKTEPSPPGEAQIEPQMPAPSAADEPVDGSNSNGISQQQTAQPGAQPEDFGPMTELRQKRLLEGMRNIKKGKHAAAFAKPVDPVAMNLPRYFEVIKQPMDLSTIEQKLKDNLYPSVNDYVADFSLMVQNSITFNGQAHPVSQAGMSAQAQLNKQLKGLPSAGDSAPPPAPKKGKRNSLPDATRESKRRDSTRQSLGAAQTPGTPHAPGPDGLPIIRRESAVGDRPKRKLVKPAPRDLAYAKPQKKKFRAELKFAEEVLTEMKRGRYASFSGAFQFPVDPVALNIPDYHKIIKHPMDVQTITEKMGSNQYENLKEFEMDFRQIFKNCYKFNPQGTVVHEMGKQYEGVFNAEMAKKNEKIAAYAPASAAASPTADSDESEEEDDEEDLDEDDRQAKIKDLTDQLQEFTQKIQSLSAGIPSKSTKGTNKKTKTKAGKGGPAKKEKRNSGAASIVAKVTKKEKPKPKPKAKKLSNAQKEEIATRIGELPTDEIAKVAEKIKMSLKASGKPVPPDDELEFNIDDIPDDLLHELYQKVRKLAAPQIKDEDDDLYESPPPAPSRAAKPKKNRPMTKGEADDQISRLQNQLATFQQAPDGQMFQGKADVAHKTSQREADQSVPDSTKEESSDDSNSESEEE